MLDPRLSTPWWTLRLAYGLVPILAGLDKFVYLLTDWRQYLSPGISALLPISPAAFLQIVGVVEILAGILVLSRLTRVGAYVVAAWLVLIAVNLITTLRFFDVAVRDLVMALGAYALGRMTEAREVEGRPVARAAVPATATT